MKMATTRRQALTGLFLLLGGLLLATRAVAPESRLQDRWVYVSYNLLPDKNVQQVQAIMRRAKAAGYNGVVLADYKLAPGPDAAQLLPERRHRAAHGAEAGLDIYPAVCPIGYPADAGSRPNLVEACRYATRCS